MNYNIFKMKYLLAAIIAIPLLLLTGCKDEDSDYINLSMNSYTFDAKGGDEVTIKVEASKSWSVEYEGKWVIEVSKDGNSITLGANPTQSGADRTSRVIFRAGEATEVVNLSQLGTTLNYSLLEPNSALTVMSVNGKYIGGVVTAMVNEVYEFTPFIINVETGVRTEKPKLDKSHIASAISDNGDLIILEEESATSKYYNSNGDLIAMTAPDGMRGPTVTASSSNGEILVGFAQNISDRIYHPVRWVRKEVQVLESPKKTLLDTPLDVGAYARGCSADGSIIYGSVADDQSALFWKNDKVDFIGRNQIKVHNITINHTGQDVTYPVVDRPIFFADHSSMSPNGKYLATTFVLITAPNKYEVATSYPAYFDFEKETLTYLTNIPGGFSDGSGATISDDGILSFACPATGFTNSYVYDIDSKSIRSSVDYAKDEYGVTISNSSLIYRITNNNKSLFGMNVLLQGSSYQYWYLNVAD